MAWRWRSASWRTTTSPSSTSFQWEEPSSPPCPSSTTAATQMQQGSVSKITRCVCKNKKPYFLFSFQGCSGDTVDPQRSRSEHWLWLWLLCHTPGLQTEEVRNAIHVYINSSWPTSIWGLKDIKLKLLQGPGWLPLQVRVCCLQSQVAGVKIKKMN